MAHTIANKQKITARVRRIVGQLNGIERAIESEAGCSAVLQQVAAARGALGGLFEELLEDHLRQHVVGFHLSDADRQAGAEELLALIRRYAR